MLVSLQSSWSIIGQINCKQCRSGSKKFDSFSSSTYQSENKYLVFDSVGETYEGDTGFDTVSIAGMDAKSQGIILISKENTTSSLQPDGIFGLGFGTSNNDAISILSTLHSQGSIGNMIFSIYINDLNNSPDLPSNGDSILIIDGHDISKYAAERNFTYIKANNWNGFWRMSFDEAVFDGINVTNGSNVIISPETSFILGPKDTITTILQQLDDNYGCYYDSSSSSQLNCNCTESYPDLILQISGVKFAIKSAGYLTKTNNSYCLPTLDYSTIEDAWILGDAFLKRFYTLYDMETMKIGFATVGYTSQISFSNTTSENGSGSESSSGDSSDILKVSYKNWKFMLIVSISGLVFLVWVSIGVLLYIKIRESKKEKAMREENNEEINNEDNEKGKKDAISEQKRLLKELKRIDDNAKAEEKRLKEELKRKNKEAIAEQQRILQEIKQKNEKAIVKRKKLEKEIKRKNENAIAERRRIGEEQNRKNEDEIAELNRLEEERKNYIEIAEKEGEDAENSENSSDSIDIIEEEPLKVGYCNICDNLVAVEKLKGLPCCHMFCERDLREHLEKNIKENSIKKALRCPIEKCGGKISSLIIQSLVSRTLWEKLNSDAQKEKIVLDE